MKEYLKFKRSFTLIELLVVIAIIGLLSSVILVNLSGPRQKAKITKALEFSQSVQHAIGNEAVGVWNFDDCSAKDLSGYKNDGTINGAVCVDDTPYKVVGSGQGKNALSFDGGDDYVDAGNGASLNFGTGDFTVEFWFKESVVIGWDWLLSKQKIGDLNTVFVIALHTEDNILRVGLGPWFTDVISNQPSISKLTWHHLIVKRGSGTVSAYIDGVIYGTSGSSSYDMNNFTGNLLIGKYSTSYFNGLIDNVHIYSTALSVYEIQQHYLAGLEKHQKLTIK